ncbi:MG2 domain protein [uncultured archaeon]|nr:MG2 domain protein [uncultured archaeon]
MYVTATGLDPQKVVQVQLLDSYGHIVTQDQTRTDSAGSLSYGLGLPNLMVPGNFQVKLVSGSVILSQPITITAYTSQNSGLVSLSGSSYLFTAQTDKSIYQIGDVIKVFGTGAPNTGVSAVLTDPSGRTYTSSTTAQSDGTYALYYQNSLPFETGNWSVTVANQGMTRVFYLVMEPISSPFLFTAQTDRTVYLAGDLIWISGFGLPSSNINAVLTSPSGVTYTETATTTSDGSYTLSYLTSVWYESGYWYITLTNQGEIRQLAVTINQGSSSSSSGPLTAQTDKSFYIKGEPIQVTGVGKPYTTVKADFTSPSQTTFHVAATTGSDGSYLVSLPTSPSDETGNWIISITNWQLTKVLSIYLQP